MLDTVLFDVNETLFPLDPIRQRMDDAGLPDGTLEVWFAAILIDGIGAAAADTFATFPDLARQHAGRLLRRHGLPDDAEARDTIVAGFGDVVPHPDVEPTFRRLRDAGLRIGTLTNGAAAVTRSFLERAGLDDLVDHVWDVEVAGVWKPRPEPYVWAAAQLDAAPGRVALLAAHPWDVNGAANAGLRSGWVDRDGAGTFPDAFRRPDATGRSLESVAEALLHLDV